MKPIYKILIIAIILIIFGIVFYFLWQKFTEIPDGQLTNDNGQLATDNGTTLPIGKTGTGDQQPTTNDQQPTTDDKQITIQKISDNQVFDFVIVPETKEVFYLTPDGKIFGAKKEKDLEISAQTINALNFVVSSADNQKILAAFGDPRAPQWGIFDLIDKVWRPLPNDIFNATWGKDNAQIIAVIKKGSDYNLTTLDITKTPPSAKILIKDFRFKDLKLIYKQPLSLLMIEKPAEIYKSRVWELNLDPKKLTITQLIQGENGLMMDWSRTGEIVFQFKAPNDFHILDKNLGEKTPLFFATFPSKCDYNDATKTAYCFAPQDFPPTLPNLKLPDDYLQKRFYTIDDLYAVDTEKEEINKVLTSGSGDFEPIDAKNPRYGDGKIYFVNQYDNYLYEIIF